MFQIFGHSFLGIVNATKKVFDLIFMYVGCVVRNQGVLLRRRSGVQKSLSRNLLK